MRHGLKRFTQAGIRAARIDDICRDVGIAKGSLYAFFPSKEDMFMAIVEEREALHRSDMIAFLTKASGRPETSAGRFFDMIMSKVETDPVLNIVLANGEIPHLRRKLGDERFAAAQRADLEFARDAAALWSRGAGRSNLSAGDLLALLTIMLSVASERQNMTPDQYGPAVGLLRQLFISRLTAAPA
jgi:AcrR family transcriptional regulator